MKIAVYIRVSSEDQNTEIQKEQCLAYCKMKGWSDIEIFEEKMSSASFNRPQFKAMLDKALLKEVNVVLFWKFDRFSRSLRELIDTMALLESHGVSIVSISESLDTTTSSGRLMVHIIGAFAEYERNLIAERTRIGREKAMSKGVKFGPKIRISAPMVKSMRKSGMTFKKIAKKLKFSKSGVYRAYVS